MCVFNIDDCSFRLNCCFLQFATIRQFATLKSAMPLSMLDNITDKECKEAKPGDNVAEVCCDLGTNGGGSKATSEFPNACEA
jgi:hypothetical protein